MNTLAFNLNFDLQETIRNFKKNGSISENLFSSEVQAVLKAASNHELNGTPKTDQW
ncbi:hypothetical protein [Ferviditalea candida]|uniref:Uncharacterized protein n=1 Tax=Ferviditalea candida TaxID=3108399 RepID=A0ABU5ZI70_9BACL|nr:hypothetical protein [Paenibacillaceae bacterium T2]